MWTKETIQELLRTSDRAVERAVMALYKRQTVREKYAGSTSERNHRGFNQGDSYALSVFAKQLNRSARGLTPPQLAVARRKVLKYWRQLQEVANKQ